MATEWSGSIVGRIHILGLREQDIAERAGITRQYFSQIIRSDYVPLSFKERVEQAVFDAEREAGGEIERK